MTTLPKTLTERMHEAGLLRKMKPTIRHYSAFGDNNWEAMEAEIKVLEDSLDEDDIYNHWPEEEETNQRNSALDAMYWANGDPDQELPSDSWKDLVVK